MKPINKINPMTAEEILKPYLTKVSGENVVTESCAIKAMEEYRAQFSKPSQPYGYLFKGRFYSSLDYLKEQTLSEENQPIPLFISGESGWVSVEERLPEIEQSVLCVRNYTKYGNDSIDILIGRLHHTNTMQAYGGASSIQGSGFLTGHYWSFPSITRKDVVTHWQPLPQPPTK